MQIRNLKLGQWVRVIYDGNVVTIDEARKHKPLVLDGLDVHDGIVVAKDHPSDPKPLSCKVFIPGVGIDELSTEQLVRTGNFLETGDTGLND